MKIKKVSTWKKNLELTRPYTIAYERVEVVENLFVLIKAENGLIGIGAGSPDEYVTGESIQAGEEALGEKLDPILAGADIRRHKTLLRRLAAVIPAAPAALASPATRYLDLDGSFHLARDVVQGRFVLKNGWLRTTDQPGLGVSGI